MPDERIVARFEQILNGIAGLGGKREQTAIITNVLVIDAAPTAPANSIIIQDPRDGDYIPALTVPGIVYNNNDLVNVLFVEGTEPIAFQQGTDSSTTSGLWQLESGTGPDIYYDDGNVGIGLSTVTAQLDVDQSSATGAKPAIKVDQGDTSEQCIQFSSDSADQDINLYTVDVTGTPTVLWDESEDSFSQNKGLIVTAGDILVSASEVEANAFGRIVKNTSGAAVSAGDCGYIDASREFQTTTTAEDERPEPVFVIIGGANNADIYVTEAGRLTANYTGSAPTTGQYLTFSATAGKVQARSTFHPGVIGYARANGSGGTVAADLLCRTVEIPVALSNSVFQNNSARSSDSTWAGTIATLPGGADLTYSTSSGNADCLPPNSTSLLAKMRLYNSTRAEYGLIDDANTGTSTITLTAAVPGTWMAGDTITIDSQTNTSSLGSAKFMDFEITSSEISAITRAIKCEMAVNDTAAAGQPMRVHPWETNTSAKRAGTNTPGSTSTEEAHLMVIVPLISQRFCAAWTAGGAGTALFRLRPRALLVAR